jgi:hypothetical protein
MIHHQKKEFVYNIVQVHLLKCNLNGDEVHKIYGDGYEIVLGGKNVQINANVILRLMVPV